jgi:oligo-1,6-glucosidase/alpha-glucosidase
MIDWWLAKGIDGFRMDVINLISKPEGLPDGDPDSDSVGIEQFSNGPRTQEFLNEMAAETFDDYDAMTVGECVAIDVDTAGDYVSADGPLDMVFHFEHMQLDRQDGWWGIEDWSLPDLKSVMAEWQTDLDGWNTVYLGNHDQPRIVSRFGDDGDYREESAKLLATFLLTHQGTPFLFQGDEIGMTNCPWESFEEMQDADASNRVRLALESGDIEDYDEARDVVEFRSRDNARTPMQWDDSKNAGFTDGDPWIKVNPNYEDINVAAAEAREDGILSYYRDLIDLRSELDVLVYGEYELLLPDHETVYAYRRTLDDPAVDVDDVLVVLNVAPAETSVSVPVNADADLLFGTELDGADDATDRHGVTDLDLRPYEARLYELS